MRVRRNDRVTDGRRRWEEEKSRPASASTSPQEENGHGTEDNSANKGRKSPKLFNLYWITWNLSFFLIFKLKIFKTEVINGINTQKMSN